MIEGRLKVTPEAACGPAGAVAPKGALPLAVVAAAAGDHENTASANPCCAESPATGCGTHPGTDGCGGTLAIGDTAAAESKSDANGCRKAAAAGGGCDGATVFGNPGFGRPTTAGCGTQPVTDGCGSTLTAGCSDAARLGAGPDANGCGTQFAAFGCGKWETGVEPPCRAAYTKKSQVKHAHLKVLAVLGYKGQEGI